MGMLEDELEEAARLEEERKKKLLKDAQYEVEDTVKRVYSHRGIIGTVVANSFGMPIKSTMDNVTALKFASFLVPLALKMKALTEMVNGKDDLVVFRIRTKLYEIIVTPDRTTREYFLIIVQKIGRHVMNL